MYNKLNWISVEDAYPDAMERVYVVFKTPKYQGGFFVRQTLAEYIPYMTVKEEDYMSEDYWGIGDYNEEEDEYYTPEGFYEYQFGAEVYWKLSDEVTHWMPLLPLPKE